MDMKSFSLEGKVAWVTGASYGIGMAIVKAYHDAGAKVVFNTSRQESVDKGLEEYRKCGMDDVEGYVCDVTDENAVQALAQKIIEKFGRLDILVNNAGIQIRHSVLAFPIEDWDKVIELNLTAVFDLAQWAANLMVVMGKGKIINIASVNAIAAGINTVAYCATKGGVMQLTKTMANELSSRGVNVNCIAPGYMATPINTALVEDTSRFDELSQRIPAKRWGQPEDMAGAVVYLASDASDYVCGVMLPVDGGYLSR